MMLILLANDKPLSLQRYCIVLYHKSTTERISLLLLNLKLTVEWLNDHYLVHTACRGRQVQVVKLTCEIDIQTWKVSKSTMSGQFLATLQRWSLSSVKKAQFCFMSCRKKSFRTTSVKWPIVTLQPNDIISHRKVCKKKVKEDQGDRSGCNQCKLLACNLARNCCWAQK